MRRIALAIVLAAAALPALAHPGHAGAGVAAGLLHPFTGLDHLLALLAAGIWSARRRGGCAFFLAAMAAGAAAGMAGVAVPGLEGALALSVIVAGVLVACAVRLPAVTGFLLLGICAALHGNAHGLELPSSGAAAGYLAASALLLAAGRMVPMARVAGAVIAAAGLAMSAL
jgi:urease accessory protein